MQNKFHERKTLVKQRTLHGKHPMVLNASGIYKRIERLILRRDHWARIINKRFCNCHIRQLVIQIKQNTKNPLELFLRIKHYHKIQNYLIICSSPRLATLCYQDICNQFTCS